MSHPTMEQPPPVKPQPVDEHLSRHLMLILAAVIAVTLLLFSALIIYHEAHVLEQRLTQRLENTLKLAQHTLPTPIWEFNTPYVREFIHALFLYDEVVHVLVKSGDRELARQTRLTHNHLTGTEMQHSKQIITASRPIYRGDEIVGSIEIALTRHHVNNMMWHRGWIATMLMLLLMGVVSLAVYILLRRHITLPLAQLESTATRIAKGHLDQRIKPVGHCEIARLAYTFDHMMIQLRQMTASRDELDREVLKRQESVQRYRQLFDSMINGFALHEIILDSQGTPCDYRFLEVNPMFETLTGLTAEQVVGRTILEALPQLEAHWIEAFGIVALTGEPMRFENYSAELRRYYDVSAYQPKPKHFAVVFTDITERVLADKERRELEARLTQSQKMEAIGLLAGGVAHDFNNILSIIIGFSELTQSDLPPDSESQEHVEGILTASLRARDLVRQLLTFSRNNHPLQKRIELTATVNEALHLSQASLPKSVTITSDFQARHSEILADPTQIHQVIMNLCTNAAHAMGENGGVISIQQSAITLDSDSMQRLGMKHSDVLRLTFLDNGSGVPDAIRHRIFDPFFTTKSMGDGTGMGLAVAHGIMRQCQGAITLESPSDGGSRFILFFPCAPKFSDN
ncbi:MAG: HAMP domain-containing protein [Magnetococcales bacterium]|nr:HAMP domain-containing protein [Magnetococcales bacterium]